MDRLVCAHMRTHCFFSVCARSVSVPRAALPASSCALSAHTLTSLPAPAPARPPPPPTRPAQIPGWNDEAPMKGGESTGETLSGFGDLHGHAAKDPETLAEIKDDSVRAATAAEDPKV